jgi:hypothetical protein
MCWTATMRDRSKDTAWPAPVGSTRALWQQVMPGKTLPLTRPGEVASATAQVPGIVRATVVAATAL